MDTVDIKRRPAEKVPRALVESWVSTFSVSLTEAHLATLVLQVAVFGQEREREEREACAKLMCGDCEASGKPYLEGDNWYHAPHYSCDAQVIWNRSKPKVETARVGEQL